MIIKQLKVPKSDLGDDKDCPRSGHPCTARTFKIIKPAHERVRRNPKRSIRKMAQEMLRVSVESFKGRLERVVKTKGGHIEI